VQSVSYNLNTGTEATSTYKIYQRTNDSTTEVEILGVTGLGTASTTNLVEWAGGHGYITGGENCDMIFRVTSDSITDAGSNLVQIMGVLE
jgi:hypothetical protein